MKLGVPELLIILAVVVIVLGPTQIPKLTKMFGKSVKSFKDGLGESEEDPPPEKTGEEKPKPDGNRNDSKDG